VALVLLFIRAFKVPLYGVVADHPKMVGLAKRVKPMAVNFSISLVPV
jgi:hypothetical protein